MARAVIFDFSGTLFRCEDTKSWLSAGLRQAGVEASESDSDAAAARLARVGGQPGGPPPSVEIPPQVADLWEERDSTAQAHRAAYTSLIGLADLPWTGLADVLYDRHATPHAWQPYPDSAAVLTLLAGRAVPAVVVSNIGWDLRPVFRHHGVDDLVRGYLLSFEEGVRKPDPRIFLRACGLLGQAPADVLMVGDDPVADAAAAAIGCTFRAVPHLPPAERPRSLLNAVADVGR